MRNFRPPSLGYEDLAALIQTSPGRVDPRTGEYVTPTALISSRAKALEDLIETSPGRTDPRTGRAVLFRNLSEDSRRGGLRHAGEPSRFGRPTPDRFQRRGAPELEYSSIAENFGGELSGPGSSIGCDTCGGLGDADSNGGPGIALWLFIGAGVYVALEAFGMLPGSATANGFNGV